MFTVSPITDNPKTKNKEIKVGSAQKVVQIPDFFQQRRSICEMLAVNAASDLANIITRREIDSL